MTTLQAVGAFLAVVCAVAVLMAWRYRAADDIGSAEVDDDA